MNDDCTWHASMLADLVVAGLAERTQEAYLRAARQLSRFYDGRDPTELSEQQVKEYLLWLRAEKRAAGNAEDCHRRSAVLLSADVPP